MKELKTEELKLHKGQRLSDTKKFKNGTPCNYIIFKTLPGIGATHGEILLYKRRNSIIIEANVPVIQGKESEIDPATGQRLYPDMLGVYEKVSKADVAKYLKNRDKARKIVCTPEAYATKVRPAIEEDNDYSLYDDFFMLFDECDKLTSDTNYRAKILNPMDDFFRFKNKAMISATALTPSDPRFSENGFKILKVVPQFDYRKPITLWATNNVTQTLKKVMAEQSKVPTFIFLNSTDQIFSIITVLGIEENTKVFCADKSVKKLNKMEFWNAYSILGDFQENNFLTSRFFSAVDIKLPYKPNVVIITNVYQALHSIIDPYTDTIQIAGRFRNGANTLTHISNFNPGISFQPEEETLQKIKDSYEEYKRIADRKKEVNTIGGTEAIKQALGGMDISKFVGKSHELLYFMVDNHLQEQRVKSHYRSIEHLANAYRITKYFNLSTKEKYFSVSDLQLLKLELEKGRNKMIENVAILLHSGEYTSAELGKIVFNLGMTKSDLKNYFKEIVEDYDYLGGYKKFEELGFNYAKIKRAVKTKRANETLLNEDMQKEIKLWYKIGDAPLAKDVKTRLKAVYHKYGIDAVVKSTDIKLYYEASYTTDANGEHVWRIDGIK